MLAMLSQLNTRASEVSTAIFMVTLSSSPSVTQCNYNKFDGMKEESHGGFFFTAQHSMHAQLTTLIQPFGGAVV
jgi:hypothetical protein